MTNMTNMQIYMYQVLSSCYNVAISACKGMSLV